jgi:putative membrane protein
MRTLKDYAIIASKGLAMGAADVVPGVSGGTIAFISGIYEELIDTISSVNFGLVRIWRKEGFKAFWKALNGNFLVALLSGIAVSILSLAKLFSYLLTNHPIPTWAFFFGLILASVPLVGREVKNWSGSRYFALAAGTIIAWLITDLPPVSEPGTYWYLFLSGMVAICAMILPGISGSFILILMGSYLTILAAITDFDVKSIVIFAAGAITGILAFSRLLKYMFSRFHDVTVAVLSGFLLGSLNQIWPWKNILESFVKYEGTPKEKIIPIAEENLLPGTYETLTGAPSQFGFALIMAFIGMSIIAGLWFLASKRSKK